MLIPLRKVINAPEKARKGFDFNICAGVVVCPECVKFGWSLHQRKQLALRLDLGPGRGIDFG